LWLPFYTQTGPGEGPLRVAPVSPMAEQAVSQPNT